MNGNRHDRTRRCLIPRIARKGGVVGALSFSTKALGERDLAVGGGLGGVSVLDAVEVVVDGNGLAADRLPLVSDAVPPIDLGSKGDFLIDGRSGGGRSEGDADRGFDVDVEDAACR